MTPPTLEQIARETAEKIRSDLLTYAGGVDRFGSMQASTDHAQSLVLAALQTATKQPQGADWAEAAAKEITGFISPQWDPFYISAKQKKVETDAAIIRRHAAPLVANREDSERDSGCALIVAERQRQISQEGWTEDHDDTHQYGELADAAGCYALARVMNKTRLAFFWPWDFDWWKPTPNNRIKELAKAGALIAAEIDRLNRAAMRPAQPERGQGEDLPDESSDAVTGGGDK